VGIAWLERKARNATGVVSSGDFLYDPVFDNRLKPVLPFGHSVGAMSLLSARPQFLAKFPWSEAPAVAVMLFWL
jgi:hypothetical protein